MNKNLNFTLVFKKEPEGGYTVTVPILPGCVTYGKSLEEAKAMAGDAIRGYVSSLKKHKEIVPSEDTVFYSSINIEDKINEAVYAIERN